MVNKQSTNSNSSGHLGLFQKLVHILLSHHKIEDKAETYTDNLLLPTSALYRLDEVTYISSSSIQIGNQLLPFKPVHPNVSFFLSKKEVINSFPHWIEVLLNFNNLNEIVSYLICLLFHLL